jgi:uncharacterized membrane protein YsdA (DUF1294 family)/cold shock CspA family protein
MSKTDRIDVTSLREGTLVFWNDEKGFGFVRPADGSEDYFAHISVFDRQQVRRPEIADRVLYQEALDPQGRRRLSYAMLKGAEREAPGTVRGILTKSRPPHVSALICVPLVLSSYIIWHFNNPLPLMSYVFLSILTMVLYGYDKRHAIQGQWRIPELYIHVLEILGGWPGSLIAQIDFSHKTRKSLYRRRLQLIIAAHGVAWGIFLAFHFWPRFMTPH